MKHIQVKIIRINEVESNDLKQSHLQVIYQQEDATAIWGSSSLYSYDINSKKSIGENIREHLTYIRAEYKRRETVRATLQKRIVNFKTVQAEILNKQFTVEVED